MPKEQFEVSQRLPAGKEGCDVEQSKEQDQLGTSNDESPVKPEIPDIIASGVNAGEQKTDDQDERRREEGHVAKGQIVLCRVVEAVINDHEHDQHTFGHVQCDNS